MAEEIRIKVIQENQGDALKKAADEKERLERHNGGKSSLATPPPNINAPQPPTKQQETAARREVAQRNKALIADAEEDLAKARAKGAGASVTKDIESQLREQKLKARFMREQGLPEDEALSKAQNLVALQNEARARKEAHAQQSADEKRAAKEKAAAEKQSQREAAAAEKLHTAEQKKAAQDAAKDQVSAAQKARQHFDTQERASDLWDRRRNYGDSLKAQEMRAGGDRKGAEALERQVKIRERATFLEKDLALSRREATALAEREVAAASRLQGGGGLFSAATLARGAGQIITAGLGFIKRVRDDQVDASRGSAQIAAHGIEAQNRTLIVSGMSGVRGEDEATADFHAKRGELEALKAKRGTFTGIDGGYWDQFKSGLKSRFGAKTWFGGSPIETDGERAERENEEKISRGETDLKLSQHLAQKKFREGTGGDELNAMKARLGGHMQEARAIEYKILAQKTYDSLLEKSGSKEMAEEGARLSVAEKAKADAGSFAKLVTARDGAADTARVATAAHTQRMESERMATQVLEKIHNTQKTQFAAGMAVSARHDFTR